MLNMNDDLIKGANFCATIGKNTLLSQGAGGNYSWKSEDRLFIKASGMWLSDANSKNIFVDLNRIKYLNDLKANNFDVDLMKYSQNGLKPSIETSIHALLPQKYVIHLHPVKILSVLIKNEWQSIIQKKINNSSISFNLVDYHKPGKELAEAIHNSMNENPNSNVYFLKNHGIIVAENNFETFKELLLKTLALFSKSQFDCEEILTSGLETSNIPDYLQFTHPVIDKLISKNIFQRTLEENWRLYPDHLVFMGMHPLFVKNTSALPIAKNTQPVIFFNETLGCFIHKNHTKSQLVQLKCYFDVLSGIDDYSSIDSLSESASLELLNWDAEKYRLSIQK
jgi:rhamnose utilization protein RhaD (predicted bifunctional aldolase and dehydrogenase)